MKMFKWMIVAMIGMSASVCRAQLTFSGPAALAGPVFSDAALTPAASYTITSPASGINLTGDFYVTTSGTGTGSMLNWAVDRPISGGTASFNITTAYTGFISMTAGGTNNPTGGVLITTIYNSGTVFPGSTCVVQFSQSGLLTNFASSNTVTVTGYTYTPGDTLRLEYRVPFDYVGLGDMYDLNFPAEAIVSEVPEPASLGLLAIGAGVMLLRQRRRG